MHIEIDFDVFKALTALRESESDSYNSVMRRLLRLPPEDQHSKGALADYAPRVSSDLRGALSTFTGAGAWFSNVHLPDGTKFRATYKGRTYFAEIRDGEWIGEDGVMRTSPSDAASAVSDTNVNGWRFWYAQMPGETDWRKLDELRSS